MNNLVALKPQTLDEMWTKLEAVMARVTRLEEENVKLKRKLADVALNEMTF